MPDEHGRTEQSHYQRVGAGYLQPGDFAPINIGAVSYQGRTTPTGAVMSLDSTIYMASKLPGSGCCQQTRRAAPAPDSFYDIDRVNLTLAR